VLFWGLDGCIAVFVVIVMVLPSSLRLLKGIEAGVAESYSDLFGVAVVVVVVVVGNCG
jgi:hypothetical protein